ncbi:MAG: hypothetical protein J2P24_14720 [Streptosporangiales bacterium]|nr:hypothetical protein [Streptosporangiales bacterium]
MNPVIVIRATTRAEVGLDGVADGRASSRKAAGASQPVPNGAIGTVDG